MAARPSVFVDLTMDDDSLSELSEEEIAQLKPASPSKPKSPSPSKSALNKSASSSSLSKAKATPMPKARKSEPIAASDKRANGTAEAATSSSSSPSSSSRRPPISDVVRARTHVNEAGGVQKLCHQHHQPCKGALLQCTFMRAPGKRCQVRYCFTSLRRFYDQDPETIVKSNRMMVNPAEHCPPSEAKYAWKCPRCRKKCDCSTCRKAAGLEPLGRWSGSVKASDPAKPAETKPGKGKGKARDNATKPSKAAAKGANGGAKPKERTLAEAVAAAQKKANGAAADNRLDDDDDDGIHTPPPPGAGSAAKENNLASMLSGGSKAPIFRPLKPPAEVAPPVFELISTKLPEDNMRARMWIYESMVRFDKFGLNRSVLSQLDKFEHWTHAMAQDMLACLLKTIAGLSHIDKGQPTKPFARAITSFRTHAKSLQRGEPWAAATELLAMLGLTRTPLPHVEHDIPVEVEAAAAERSPSPPAARVTRARRAKENRQYDVARQLSLLDEWEAEEFGEAGADDADDDGDAPRNGRRARGSAKKSIYVYDDPSDDDDSSADPDDGERGRRSARARRPVQKEPTPEVRLTGRQQAIRLQQEQQQKEEEAARQKEEAEEATKQESRKRSKPSHDEGDSDSGPSDANSDDDSQADDAEDGNVNGVSSRKRRRTAVGSSDDEADPVESQPGSVNGKSKGDASMEQDAREMESPDLETKVSILSALIDAAVMADGVADELKAAGDNIAAQERTNKAANAEMEKELVEELAELNKRAPSIVSREYQRWKAEKADLEHDHAWRRLDARVTSELAVDVHAVRTGPLGCDVDGREFWHLREYQERMPKLTEGRYAWCLVVLGPAFPVDPNQAAAAAETDEAGDADGETGEAPKHEGDDSGLTSLDESSDAAAAETGNTRLGLPHSITPTNGVKTEADASESKSPASSERVCMGANNPRTIQTLIEYTTYRLERVEYEENVAMQERERRAQHAKDADADASTVQEGGESMYSIRKAKQALKDTQEERRKQVEQLVKRLHKTKEYFAWHREELAP